jgi:two-component system, LytTR family, sensor kinase
VSPLTTTAAPSPRFRGVAGGAWLLFWALLAAVAVQDHSRSGQTDLWRPLFWEGSSCLVLTPIVWLHWRAQARAEALLGEPWRWFAVNLLPLLVIAPLFVALVYGLRHAVYALLGMVYVHAPWPQVLLYESVKLALFYSLFVAVTFGVRSHRAMSAQQLRAEQALALTRQAQLLQLAQQLEPHFLFNALNTIASTLHTDPQRADALLMRLAALLRAATELARRPFSTLAEELVLLENYAAIMCERFGDRVQLSFEIEPRARACRLPTLALQPLLENAFRHGVEKDAADAQIVLSARCDAQLPPAQRLLLTLRCSSGRVPTDWQPGVGLSNLRERLATAYGPAATLTLHSGPNGVGSVAQVELPGEPG